MRFLVVLFAIATGLAGCQSKYELTGTNASGTEVFKGSALGFYAGKLDVKSNKGRKCTGRFDTVNDKAVGYGKGKFNCSDGNVGTFWFNINAESQSGNGTAMIGGEKFKFTYGRPS